MMGLSQNMANVTVNTTELANTLGVPPSIPLPGAPMTGAKQAEDAGEEAGKQASQGSDQAMQTLSQLGSMAGQLPQMLMQIPQQMMQPLQQLSQPLQQLTSMFGQGGKSDSMGAAGLPFSSFSNHPLAGGGGAGGGSGMVRAASLPGSGGSVADAVDGESGGKQTRVHRAGRGCPRGKYRGRRRRTDGRGRRHGRHGSDDGRCPRRERRHRVGVGRARAARPRLRR